MPPDIAYALAALVCYGLGDFIYKRAAIAGIGSEHFIMGQAWLFCPAVVLYAWASGTLHFTWAALWSALAGLFLLVGFYNFSRSLKGGAVSVIAPIFRLNFIVTVALAVGWLQEPLTTHKLIGFALSLLAGWLLLGVGPKGAAADPASMRRSLVRVLVATVAFGAGSFCHKLGLLGGGTPETLLAAQALVFSTSVTVMAYLVTGTVRPPRGFIRHSGPAAVLLIAASLFLLYGLKLGQASVIVPITQMGFVVAALLGVLVFKEAWTGRKIAGLAAAAAALSVLAFS